MKISLEESKHRIEMSEEGISKPEGISIGILQSEE